MKQAVIMLVNQFALMLVIMDVMALAAEEMLVVEAVQVVAQVGVRVHVVMLALQIVCLKKV